MLASVASEDNSDDDSDHSSVREVVFSTLISPSRGTMLPPVRPTTPEAEATRKRSFTLVHRTPEKPREAPVAPTTPLNTMTRETYCEGVVIVRLEWLIAASTGLQ